MTQGRLDAGTYKAKRKRNPRPRWALFKLGRSFCRQSTEALTTSHQSAGTTVYQARRFGFWGFLFWRGTRRPLIQPPSLRTFREVEVKGRPDHIKQHTTTGDRFSLR